MTEPGRHIVFYDGDCGLCNRAVRFLLARDSSKQFLYAPLAGETAKRELPELLAARPDLDSMVLIENYGTSERHVYVEAQAALRCAWHLGGLWKVPGLLSFLPGWCFAWAYRILAANRKKIFDAPEACPLPPPGVGSRFLP